MQFAYSRVAESIGVYVFEAFAQPSVCILFLYANTTPDLKFLRKFLEVPARAKNSYKGFDKNRSMESSR